MKPSLLLLHGALGSKQQFGPLEALLSPHFTVHSIDFAGHGGLPVPQGGFSIACFAEDVLAWMEQSKTTRIDIFGYSMGGYVALYLAKHHPEKIGRVFTLATKFTWSESIAEKEVKMLNPGKIEEKVPAFAAALAARHAPQDWKGIMNEAAGMMLSMGKENPLKENDFISITHKAIIAVGDNDGMVTRDETVRISTLLRNAELLILDDTEHPIEKADHEQLASEIKDFFLEE